MHAIYSELRKPLCADHISLVLFAAGAISLAVLTFGVCLDLVRAF